MAGLQVAPLLRSRRRPPRPDISGVTSGSWCCKLTILAVLAVLALLTTFENMRAFSAVTWIPANSSGRMETTGEKTEANDGEQAMSAEEVQSSSKQELLSSSKSSSDQEAGSGSCRGIESWELWGPATLAGDRNKQASAEACCTSCREKCKTKSSCRCDSWVYCADKAECKEHFQEVCSPAGA